MFDFLGSFTLLNPWYLIGLGAAAIPLIIHLSRSRRTKKMRFSTTRFFTDQFLRSYRMSRLKELVLLACRMALFALLAMALTQPLYMPKGSSFLGKEGTRAVVLVIDNSASMGVDENGETLFDRVRQAARTLLDGLSPGDSASIVLAGRRAEGPEVLFPKPTTERSDVRQALDGLEVAALGTNLTAALAEAEKIAQDAAAANREVYVLSDLQASGWDEAGEDKPYDLSRVSFVFVGVRPEQPVSNVAVTAVRYASARPLVGVPFAIRPLIAIQGNDRKDVVARLFIDGEKAGEQRVERQANGRWAMPRFYHAFGSGGWHSGYIEVEDQAMPLDNRRFFAVQVLDTVKVLAVNGAPSRVPRLDELFFLRLALTASPEGQKSPMQVDTVAASGLSAAELSKYPLVVLANVESLPAAAVEKLEEYVENGGSLLVFLGDKVNARFYNEALTGSNRRHGGLLPGRLIAIEGDPADGKVIAFIGGADYDHSALAAFQDTRFAALIGPSVIFKALWRVDAPAESLRMKASNGAPLLCEKDFGKGRVMLFTSTCDRDWTNFPIRPVFLPWAHRLVAYLAQQPLGHQVPYRTGEVVGLPSSVSDTAAPLLVKKPNGTVASARLVTDESPGFEFDDTDQLGIYTLMRPDQTGPAGLLAVNLDGYESDLTYLDDVVDSASADTADTPEARMLAALKNRWDRPVVSYLASPSDVGDPLASARHGHKLWDYVLIVVLLIALFEPWLANRISARLYGRPLTDDKVTGRQGDKVTKDPVVSLSPCLPVTLSPCHLFADLHFEGISPSWWWLWPVLIVAGAAFLIWTYHGIFQRSERRLTWWLLALRGLGLLLLVLILAKPTWTRESEQVDPGRVAIIVDSSRSMSLPDVRGATRYRLARNAVEQLTKALEHEHKGSRVVVDLFDITGTPLKDGLPEQPTVERTDLGEALRKTALQVRSRPIAGLVLISDGMDNSGRPNFHDWGDTSLPIHGLGFRAGQTADLDLAVRKPQTPSRVLVHNEMRIEVPVVKSGKPNAEATVSIKRGREVLASRKITLAEGDAEQLVALTFTPRQPGHFVFTAAVASAAGEKMLGNNAVHFPVQVDKEPIKVLYLEGFLRWEYKYLNTRLEDDPDVALASVIRRARPQLPEGRGKERLTAERLKPFDVVLLGDMEANFLSRPEYDEIIRWLDGKDHSLLVLGGYNSFGPNGLSKTPLADVLPVVFAAGPPYQSDEAFQVQLTDKGHSHPIFLLSRDRVKNAALWKDAPPLRGLNLVQRAKPGAETLAVHPTLERGGKPAVVLAVQRAGGGGQVMVLAADTTWQWGRFARLLGQNDTLYSRFWGQTIRFLAGRGLDDQRPLLAVSTDKASYEIGKRVTISAVRQPRPDNDLANARAAVEVVTPSGQTIPV